MKKIIYLLFTIITIFSLSSCVDNLSITKHTEHTYEYEINEDGHGIKYTCGCPSSGAYEAHHDSDNDYLCDVCGYDLHKESTVLTKYVHCTNDKYYVPEINLNEDKTFVFDNNSKLYEGTYEIKENKLYLNFSDGSATCVFTIYDYYLVLTEGKLPYTYLSNKVFIEELTKERVSELVADLIETNEPEVKVSNLYDLYSKYNKPVIPFMLDEPADGALWTDKVGDISLHYSDGRSIKVFYDNNIYTLQEAYELEILSFMNLIDIARIQNLDCKYQHCWDEGHNSIALNDEEITIYCCYICGDSKVLDSDETYDDPKFHEVYTGGSGFEYTHYRIINNKTELMQYYDDYKELYEFDINYGTSFLDMCNQYTDEFFESNSLVVYNSYTGNSAYTLEITSYQIKDDLFIINTNSLAPKEPDIEGADVISSYHMILEVESSKLAEISCVAIIQDGTLLNKKTSGKYISEWYEFLLEIDPEEIKEIQYAPATGSVEPGTMATVLYSSDSSEIKRVLRYLLDYIATPIHGEPWLEKDENIGYVNFITDSSSYKIPLTRYLEMDGQYYNVEYYIPLYNCTSAKKILTYKESYDVYYLTNNHFVLTSINYLSDIVFKEYDNEDSYYLSDQLYIDLDGAKIRIIDEKHIEYNGNYYEVVGEKDLSDIIAKTMVFSAYRPNWTLSFKYPNKDEILFEIIMVDGDTLTQEIFAEIMCSYTDLCVVYYFYLDEDCFTTVYNLLVENNQTLYISSKSPDCE